MKGVACPRNRIRRAARERLGAAARAQGQHRRQRTLHHQLDVTLARPDRDLGDQTARQAERLVADRRILQRVAVGALRIGPLVAGGLSSRL